jgi:hypothetical protein
MTKPSYALLGFRALLGFEDRAFDLRERILQAYALVDPHRGKAFDASEIDLLRERLGEAYEIAFKLCEIYDDQGSAARRIAETDVEEAGG